MKRGIAALLMAFLLADCGAPGGSLSAEESIDDAETVLHGETFTAENGCANLALTLPEGWEGETADTPEDGGTDACHIEFWPADAPELRLTLRAYLTASGYAAPA